MEFFDVLEGGGWKLEKAEIDRCFASYYEYLNSIGTRMPNEALSFAAADWHYDDGKRGPHDSWIEELVVLEGDGLDPNRSRPVNFRLTLLGAYHDHYVNILYEEIHSYSLVHQPGRRNPLQSVLIGHGDWLIDEVRLSSRGLVVHEILFSNHSRWIIECSNIVYSISERSIPDR